MSGQTFDANPRDAWNPMTHRKITAAKLRLASPETVSQALEEYGQSLRASHFPSSNADPELELQLAERNEPLIDLALARNASTSEIIEQLYRKATAGTGEASFHKAIRLACLENEVAPASPFFEDGLVGIDQTELVRFALHGDEDELTVLMRNPKRRWLLRDVYARLGPMSALPDNRWLLMVRASIGNEGLNIDESNVDGPDLLARDIQRALYNLVCNAPVELPWLYTLLQLLVNVGNAEVAVADTKVTTYDVLRRWSALDCRDHEGFYTSLSLTDEFRCTVAALYGRVIEKGESSCIGQYSDDDVALRCAYYAFADPNAFDINEAFQKDRSAFTLSALYNNRLMRDEQRRAYIEDFLSDELLGLYAIRCRQLKVCPPTRQESFREMDVSMHERTIDSLAAKVETLESSIRSVSTSLSWAKTLLFITLLVLWARTF